MRISRLALAFAATGLVSCGYTPLYAPNQGAAEAAQYVRIGEIAMGTIKTPYTGTGNVSHGLGLRRVAQTVTQRLKLSFPGEGQEADVLTASIDETTSTLAVQSTAALQRAEIVLTAHIWLTSASGDKLLNTDLSTAAPYNVENTPYSTESGKTYARLTAARNLADEISRRLALYYRMHNPAAAK